MDSAVSKILAEVYELEGLLLVMDKRGSETPAVVHDMICRHAAAINEMTHLLERPSLACAEPEPVPEPTVYGPPPTYNEVTEPEAIDNTAEDINDDDTPPRHDDDEPGEVFAFDMPEVQEPIPQEPTPTAGSMRVDEKLHRTISKDLRRAFSVNDRFRFRRELFGNSEAEFVDALNMIEAMHSYEEATEYFLNDLGWDENVAEVSEFLNIVRHHFDA